MGDLLKKSQMTEEDIKLQFITPAIEAAGWDRQKQIRMEYSFTDGRVIVRGNITARGKRKRTDYLLYYKPNLPLAIVEAKDNHHSIGAGMQQGIEYAECLDVPFVLKDEFVHLTGRWVHSSLFEVFLAFKGIIPCFFVQRDLIELVLHFQTPPFSS